MFMYKTHSLRYLWYEALNLWLSSRDWEIIGTHDSLRGSLFLSFCSLIDSREIGSFIPAQVQVHAGSLLHEILLGRWATLQITWGYQYHYQYQSKGLHGGGDDGSGIISGAIV